MNANILLDETMVATMAEDEVVRYYARELGITERLARLLVATIHPQATGQHAPASPTPPASLSR